MWYFFAVAVPFTLGMVVYTLQYFASPQVLAHVKAVVTYAWLVNMSIVVLVPFDVWTTICTESNSGLSCSNQSIIDVLWSLTYWSAFFLTWLIIPMLQGYEDAADFTMAKRIKSSLKGNLIFYSSVGGIGLAGAVILLATKELAWDNLLGLAIGASNAFGLVTGALLLGFGLIEIPRGLWRHADLHERTKWLSHKVAKVAEKLDEAHQELSTAIVITQATSNQMSRRDPLRPIMDLVDEMANEDPSFKPSGGRIGENDMDYDTDEKSMAALRWRLRHAQDMYSRYKTEYTAVIWQALEVEDTIKNLDAGSSGDRRFVSRLRPSRKGTFAPVLDFIEWYWRCSIRSQVMQMFAVILGLMSFAIIFAEATMLSQSWLDLSLFSVLIRTAGLHEELVQVLVFVPLVYICVCTYYSVFKLGMFSFYYLVPGHTDSVSLLMNCSMVSRYAAPMCYNFLSLIHLTHFNKMSGKVESLSTTFEQRMSVLPEEYERVYALVMVIWCLLIASSVHNRIMDVFGSWRRFRFESDEDLGEGDGSSSTGLIILRRERTSLERGMAIGENVVPLARNFATGDDIESQPLTATPDSSSTPGKPPKGAQENGGPAASPARDAVASLYATLKEAKPSLPPVFTRDSGGMHAGLKEGSHRAIAAKYANMRNGSGAQPRNSSSEAQDFSFKTVGRNSSEDLIALGKEPGSAARAPEKAPTGRSPKAPLRPATRSPPMSPPNEPIRFHDTNGLLESQWDVMRTKFKGLTANLTGGGWRSDGSAAGLDASHTTGATAAATGPSLDAIFDKLRSHRRSGADHDDDSQHHHLSLLGTGHQGSDTSNTSRAFR